MRMTIAFRLWFVRNPEPKECSNTPGVISSSCGTSINDDSFDRNMRLRAVGAFR